MGPKARCSGWYVAYCAVVLDGVDCVWAEWVDCSGNGMDDEGGVAVFEYSEGGKDNGGGMGAGAGIDMVATSGGRDALGVWALDHSSSDSLDNVSTTAASGDAYRADGLNDGCRGRGAWRRGSDA